jgi:tetratricopeptide (TPR) repeat protein
MLAIAIAAALGQSPEAQARVDAATTDLRAAVALAPTDADGYRALAKAYQEHKFLRAAAGALTAAVELTPADSEGWRELGALRQRARDPDGARDALLRAAELRPLSGAVQLELSRLSHDPEAAVRYAIQLEPTLSAAYMQLVRVLKRRETYGAEVEATLVALSRL